MTEYGEERRATRRFIAGALCPNCGTADTVALDPLPDGDRILCVECGHQEHRPAPDAAPSGAGAPPPGRLDGPVRRPQGDGNVVALRFHPRPRRSRAPGDGDEDRD